MMPNGSLCPFNSNRFVSDLQLANWPNATPSIRMKDVLHFLNLFLSRIFVLDENNINLSLLWPTGSEDSCILRLCNMLVIDEHFKRSWKPKAHHWNQKDTLLRSVEDKNAFPFVLAIGPFARKQKLLFNSYLFEVQSHQNLWKWYTVWLYDRYDWCWSNLKNQVWDSGWYTEFMGSDPTNPEKWGMPGQASCRSCRKRASSVDM